MNTVISKKRAIQMKMSDLISLFTIVALIFIIIITSYLIFDTIVKIRESNAYTVVYEKTTIEEEPEVLMVNL